MLRRNTTALAFVSGIQDPAGPADARLVATLATLGA